MPELTATLAAKREEQYNNQKFFAAIQGVDIDKEAGKSRGQKEWEDLKSKVFSKGQTSNSNDVVSLQGFNAEKAGFGIGMGLEYSNVSDSKTPKNPLE